MHKIILLVVALMWTGRASEPASFCELPPDLPLPKFEPRQPEWLKNAIVIQPWAYTQLEMMTNNTVLPGELREKYGFNTLCVMPPPALEAVHGGRQTENNFTNSLSHFRNADYKVILYSALVNTGHDPSWYTALKEHPEWHQIDPNGASKNWLCPNTGAFEFSLKYTREIVLRYGADAVMLDNNAFMDTGKGSPACYCTNCHTQFREYVRKRFEGVAPDFFGQSVEQINIPTTPGPLYGLWKHWRNRIWVERMDGVRQALPDTVVFANTQFWHWTSGTHGWFMAHDLLYANEDALLSESYFMEPRDVSRKMVLGRALARDRTFFDLVGSFEWKPRRFSQLKPASVVERLTAAAIMHGAQPWLGYYGMASDEPGNAKARAALSRILKFRANHPELFLDLTRYTKVASILPLNSYTQLGTQYPVAPPHIRALREAGVTVRGISDVSIFSEDLSGIDILIAEGVACVGQESRVLEQWIKKGGKMIATEDFATRDEIGRSRPRPSINLDTVAAADIPHLVLKQNPQRFKPSLPQVEVAAFNRNDGRLILHVANFDADPANGCDITLPFVTTDAWWMAPDSAQPVSLKTSDGVLRLPAFSAYGVLNIKLPSP